MRWQGFWLWRLDYVPGVVENILVDTCRLVGGMAVLSKYVTANNTLAVSLCAHACFLHLFKPTLPFHNPFPAMRNAMICITHFESKVCAFDACNVENQIWTFSKNGERQKLYL
jgi:hypothetical protein